MPFTHCAQCDRLLTHWPGRGKAKKYCDDKCQATARAIRLADRIMPKCCIEGCEKPSHHIGLQLCVVHYARMLRKGTTDKAEPAVTGAHTAGYVLTRDPKHPLRRPSSAMVYEHRRVYHAHHGDGPFACYWCAKRVTWDDMHVDHLNDVKDDNRPENLVASCPTCNQRRGHEALMQWNRNNTGVTMQGETLTLNEWASRFGISRTTIRNRLLKGWSVEDAITKPRSNSGPQKASA